MEIPEWVDVVACKRRAQLVTGTVPLARSPAGGPKATLHHGAARSTKLLLSGEGTVPLPYKCRTGPDCIFRSGHGADGNENG